MSQQPEEGTSATGGRVETSPEGDAPEFRTIRGKTVSFTRSTYTWRPPADLESQLPVDFSIVLECWTGSDGIRRFQPADGMSDFLYRGSVAGFALLAREAKLTAADRVQFHTSRLLYRLGPRLQEAFTIGFHRESDLYLPTAERASGHDGFLFPAHVGLDRHGNGTPWGPQEVLAQGRQAANERGEPDPSTATCIRLGLLAAARRNPLDPSSLSEAECLGLVRMALFDTGPDADAIEGSLIERVEGRLWAAFERHQDTDSAAFRRWFFEQFNNVVHAISKQKPLANQVSRKQVRQAILELVVRSFPSVGRCIDRLAEAFSRALPVPLAAAERNLFDSLYRKQSYLGGLPLACVHERIPFAKEAIADLWAAPTDQDRVGTLLRLLSYYGEMASRRRQADRGVKARGRHRNRQGQVARVHGLDPERDRPDESLPTEFELIAEVLRERRGASCPCDSFHDWKAVLISNEGDAITIADRCGGCGHHEGVTVSRDEFRNAGRVINLVLEPDDD